jgi:hypothetical protein
VKKFILSIAAVLFTASMVFAADSAVKSEKGSEKDTAVKSESTDKTAVKKDDKKKSGKKSDKKKDAKAIKNPNEKEGDAVKTK